MRQAERPSQSVAKLVMQRHADRAQANPSEPRRVKSPGAGFDIRRICGDCRQRFCHGSDRFFGHHCNDRICVARIERFHSVRDGVHAARHRRCDGQAERQFDIVDDDLRQYCRAHEGRLLAVPGLTEYRGHFGAGIRRRRNNLRQIGSKGDRLRQTRGRATTRGHQTVGPDLAGRRDSRLSHLDRRMHLSAGEDTGAPRAKKLRDRAGMALAPWR